MSFTVALKNIVLEKTANVVVPRIFGVDEGGVSFSQRLRAWWHGVPLADILADESSALFPPTQTDAVDATESAEDVLWSTARISASELLFGSGEITPGGTARILGMIGPPENLSEQSNVVNIGAGLGGTARAIAIEYDGWVAGYESDPALAAAAMAPERADKIISSSGSGVKASKLNVKVSAKAKIEHADLTKLKLKKRKV